MDNNITRLTQDEIVSVSAGSVSPGNVAMSGLSGGAAYGAIGAYVGSVAGPMGTLLGGMIGFGFGVIGGVYTSMK